MASDLSIGWDTLPILFIGNLCGCGNCGGLAGGGDVCVGGVCEDGEGVL